MAAPHRRAVTELETPGPALLRVFPPDTDEHQNSHQYVLDACGLTVNVYIRGDGSPYVAIDAPGRVLVEVNDGGEHSHR